MKTIVLLSLLLLPQMAQALPPSDPRMGAWDRSVALEIAGNLSAAEEVMHLAWGLDSQNYWVRLRLAYLALLQKRSEEACQEYQALRTMPESAEDPDVLRGHASAIAAVAWQRSTDGESALARALFREALAIDAANKSARLGLQTIPPLPLLTPELWTGISTHSMGVYRYQGTAAYAQLPIRLYEQFVVRGAFRYVYSQETTRGSPYRFSDSGRRAWHLDEEYLALARDTRYIGLEAIGLRSKTTDRSSIWGGAGRLRIGAEWGLIVESAVLDANGIATNTQLRPLAFINFKNCLVFQAGLRITHDKRGNATSANGGMSGYLGAWGLHLQGHVGNERWAFGTMGPSLMSLDVETTYGGSATLIGPITTDLHFALQSDYERIRVEGAVGTYFGLSAGIQLALGER